MEAWGLELSLPRVGLQLHSTPAERLKASSLTSLNIRPFLSVHGALTHFAWVCWEMGVICVRCRASAWEVRARATVLTGRLVGWKQLEE